MARITSRGVKLSGDWETVATDYGNLYYKKDGEVAYLRGALSGISSQVSITLPFVLKYQQVFLCAGNSLYYTKVFTTAGSNVLNIFAGTGTSNTTYNLSFTLYLA